MNLLVSPFVDGVSSSSNSSASADVINPSNGRRLLSIPAGDTIDVDRAVQAARRSFQDGRWCDAPPSSRKRALHQYADLIASSAAQLDALDASEMGKPIGEVRANGKAAAGLMRFYAEAVDKVSGSVYPSDKNSLVVQRRVPRGVVAAIVPWNFPTYNTVLKVAPALAAGNSVVLKPSEQSSRSAIHLAHLAVEAGVPPGVLNVVPGLGRIVGRALGLHNDVEMLTFTGSTEVGRSMLEYAGQSNMKVVMAECGGKSPQIVFGDGLDLAAVGRGIARSLLTNQGQICTVGSRLLVEQSIEAELIASITASFKTIVMGDATNPSTTYGPIASERQCSRVMQFIETAQVEGAELVTGGHRTLLQSGGYFIEPTLFRRVLPGSRLANEEVFGPVLAVIPFEDEAHAIRIANDTVFGLAAYVWTKDLSKAMRMAKSIRSSVWVNATSVPGEGAGHASSFEPIRQSGLGVEGGLAGMESYMCRQFVCINHM